MGGGLSCFGGRNHFGNCQSYVLYRDFVSLPRTSDNDVPRLHVPRQMASEFLIPTDQVNALHSGCIGGMGEAAIYSNEQGAPRNKATLLRESQSWYKKSLNTLRQVPGSNSVDPLGGDITEESVGQELSKCEASLAKLTVR